MITSGKGGKRICRYFYVDVSYLDITRDGHHFCSYQQSHVKNTYLCLSMITSGKGG